MNVHNKFKKYSYPAEIIQAMNYILIVLRSEINTKYNFYWFVVIYFKCRQLIGVL